MIGVKARVFRLGTRASALAQAQSMLIAQALVKQGIQLPQLVTITTTGDVTPGPLSAMSSVGVFVTALRESLLAGDIDLAIHSYKDLPTEPADDLSIAAIPVRATVNDVLITRSGEKLEELADGARIGTGAPRRIAQLNAYAQSLQKNWNCIPIRGNVDSRLSMVSRGELDAVVVAQAGLERLKRAGEASQQLDTSWMLPAPAQGALAVECRADNPALIEILRTLDDPITRATVTAERSLLRTLQAGCLAPVAALAHYNAEVGANLVLTGSVTALDGNKQLRQSASGQLHDAEILGQQVAVALIADGATQMMESMS